MEGYLYSNVIICVVGVSEFMVLDYVLIDLWLGDWFVICLDGFMKEFIDYGI